jgi:heme exporter protein C
MQKHWWKILALGLLLYTVIAGFLKEIPYFGQNAETTRNVFFHVPMWFGMLILYTVSLVYSILFLSKFNPRHDLMARSFAAIGTLFAILGIVTGMVWARVAWGSYWNNDPKLIGAALNVLIYSSYFVLRRSVTDTDKRGRIAGVYNIFAYFMIFPAIYIIPGMMVSSHPGGEGDDALMVFKMDPTLRYVFYPAVLGWTLLGVWMANLRGRMDLIKEKL